MFPVEACHNPLGTNIGLLIFLNYTSYRHSIFLADSLLDMFHYFHLCYIFHLHSSSLLDLGNRLDMFLEFLSHHIYYFHIALSLLLANLPKCQKTDIRFWEILVSGLHMLRCSENLFQYMCIFFHLYSLAHPKIHHYMMARLLYLLRKESVHVDREIGYY